jgi:rhamnose transport system permease protein
MHFFKFSRDAGLGALTLLLLALVSIAFPAFISPSNLFGMFDDTALLILLAFGEMLVLLTRGVDLSNSAVVALAGMIAALLNQAMPEAGVLPVLAISLLVGLLLGMFNGILVWQLRLPSMVVTLGTMSVYRGLVFVASGGAWVNSNQMSPAFLDFIRANVLGITVLSWFAIGLVAVAVILLRYRPLGRNLYAAGNNPSAAAYAGIDVGRMQFVAFTLAGGISGLCGYFWVSRFGVAYTDVALGFEMQVIAACVIGGVSMAGGVGTVTGVVIGALFLGIIKNALPLIGLSPFWQMAVSGLVITGAVVVNARGERSPGRRILEQSSKPETAAV